MVAQKTHLPKFSRGETPPKIILQKRDIDLLEALGKYRYLTTSQISKLIFPGKHEQGARRRLTKLYHNKYIDRLFLESGFVLGEAVYFLDRDGYKVIVQERGYEGNFQKKNRQVKPIFLRHTIDEIEFRLALEKSVSELEHIELVKWYSEYDMKDSHATKRKDKYFIYDEIFDPNTTKVISVYPDSLFVLGSSGREALYFLEVDRGTESSKKIIEKMRTYYLYFLSNKFSKYANVKRFKVLLVAHSHRRAESLRSNVQGSLGIENFLFSNKETIKKKDLLKKKIWFTGDGDRISIVK
ncbi:MAG: hypothetical protein DWQ06_16615 [Calditrichaeota bacterium]|nr:MAG: hypothetical protein DWQ06_16615 [Calditrichota bacterium]